MSEGKTRKVDMLAAAREAQWSADTFLGPGATKVVAPAKVNLVLGVGDRRDDGFHEVANVMHAVSLHDVLYVRTEPLAASPLDAYRTEDGTLDLPDHLAVVGPEDNILVSVDCSDKTALDADHALNVPARDNIVCRAVDGLACSLGRAGFERVLIRIEKNIPHQGGLGGGSSDAAAVLTALASRWQLDARDSRVAEVACTLGSDVAFFLEGGCALFGGAGECFVRSLEPMKLPIVLVKPFVGVSTPAAYRAFDEVPEGGCALFGGAGECFVRSLEPMKLPIVLVKPFVGVSTPAAYRAFDEVPVPVPADVLAAASCAARAEDVPLFNNLAPAAEGLEPVLVEVREWLAAQTGVAPEKVLLCGSGATTFAVTDSFSTACDIAASAQSRGWWARACTFSSLRAAAVPRR